MPVLGITGRYPGELSLSCDIKLLNPKCYGVDNTISHFNMLGSAPHRSSYLVVISPGRAGAGPGRSGSPFRSGTGAAAGGVDPGAAVLRP